MRHTCKACMRFAEHRIYTREPATPGAYPATNEYECLYCARLWSPWSKSTGKLEQRQLDDAWLNWDEQAPIWDLLHENGDLLEYTISPNSFGSIPKIVEIKENDPYYYQEITVRSFILDEYWIRKLRASWADSSFLKYPVQLALSEVRTDLPTFHRSFQVRYINGERLVWLGCKDIPCLSDNGKNSSRQALSKVWRA